MAHLKDEITITLYDEIHKTFIDIDNKHGDILKVNHKTNNEEIVIYIPSDIVQVKEFLTKLGFKNPDEYKSIAHEKSIIVSDSIYCIYFCHKDNKTEKILDKNNKSIDAIMDDKLYLFGSNLSVYIETSNNADLVVVLTYENNKRVIEDRYVLHKTFKYTLACSTIL